ncbi:hypothetical protein CGCTS75_v009362 [Colletotrichum tropicale]|nr:hypothetical protein CGCTS75_v009362 [Colletotrichum tropicale]
MRFSLFAIVAAVCVSSTAAEVFLQIGQACARIGDPSWESNCNAADSDRCASLCEGRCQSGDNGRWMATPKGDCDCYCN